jgi:1-deoxy-D-xylulose 5-phosphate reductoisomerase
LNHQSQDKGISLSNQVLEIKKTFSTILSDANMVVIEAHLHTYNQIMDIFNQIMSKINDLENDIKSKDKLLQKYELAHPDLKKNLTDKTNYKT